ncbi:hypothetical protein M5689_001463 [Euphorbia peplus]|nr:hypothetical protein M5689_001463 [Euphorbia peplus]
MVATNYYYDQNRSRSTSPICHALHLISVDPLPYKVLLVLAFISFFLLWPTYRDHRRRGQWHQHYCSLLKLEQGSKLYCGRRCSCGYYSNWVLPATPITILLMVHWLSRKAASRPPPGTGCSWWVLVGLIAQLLLMARFRQPIRARWYFIGL